MAGFRMHVSTSAVLGVGYAGVGHVVYGMPLDTSLVAGAMCGFSGMLPDLDSDYGVPLRETMAFTAAVLPMLLVGHFQQLHLSHDGMILAAVSLYLFVRFGITNMVRKYTVHRGMFHSLPALAIFVGLAFLACGTSELPIRIYKAGGVAVGFMSHLVLDEIYAVEWKGGRWRLKKSFGTAIKFWGDDPWANFSTYAKLVIVVMLILAQPSVFEQLEARNPQFAEQYQRFQQRFENAIGPLPGAAENAYAEASAAAGQFINAPFPPAGSGQPSQPPTEGGQPYFFTPNQVPPANSFDTARRPAPPIAQ
jgi:LexA-binding, inner membrane-associated putative hydrolase